MMNHKENILGVVLSFTQVVVYTLIGLVLTPVLIKGFGRNEFGIFELIGSLAGYLAVVDFGISSTVTRYVAVNHSNNDEDQNRRFFFQILIVFTLLFLILAILGVVLYINISTIFSKSLSISEILVAEKLFVVLMINTGILIIGKIYTGIQTGYQLYTFQKASSIIKNILNLILGILIVYLGANSIHYTVLLLFLNVILVITNIIYTTYRTSLLPKIHSVNFNELKDILMYSFYNFIQAIVGQLYWKVGGVVIGIIIGASMVSVYTISVQLNNLFLSVVTSVGFILLPQASSISRNGIDNIRNKEVFVLFGRVILILYGIFIVNFIIVGDYVINLWIGSGFEQVYLITLWILVFSIIWRIQTPMFEMARANKIHGRVTLIFLMGAVTNVGLSIIMVNHYGVIGTLYATVIPIVIFNTLFASFYYRKIYEFSMFSILRKVFRKLLSVLLVFVVIGFLVVNLSDVLLFKGAILLIFNICFVLTIYAYGMEDYERKYIKSVLCQISKRVLPRSE